MPNMQNGYTTVQRCQQCKLTLGILDKDLANIIYFVQAGTPALLGLLSPLGVAGMPPHELIVVQGAISRALGVAPPAEASRPSLPD